MSDDGGRNEEMDLKLAQEAQDREFARVLQVNNINYKHIRYIQGLLFLEFNSRIRLGDQLKNFRTI